MAVPVLWPIVERALTRYLPERRSASTLGDLREDYEKERAIRGRWRAELWLLRETTSLVVTYRAARRGVSVRAHLPRDMREVTNMRSRASNLVERLVKDARHAARGLARTPGFSATAVLTLALGIGSTTAIFSVVYGVLLKPLPFGDPDRLVALYHLAPGFGPGTNGPQGAASYFTYRDHGRVFEDIGLWSTDNVSIIRNGTPEQVRALRVTDGTLSLLGARPEVGRLMSREDDVPDAPLCVVLTHGYWQRTFGAARDVVGQSLLINTRPYEIVGVLPASFKLLDTDPQVILPLRLNRATTRTGGLMYSGLARLKPDVTLAQANDDIARIIPLIVEQFPLEAGVTQQMWDSVGLAPNVRPLAESVIGEMSRPLWILLGCVGFVLLMAWSNVANLLLVRAEGRQRELAVRTALGASRGRIAAGQLLESLMLGLAGGALGILFAQACIGLLRRMAPVALPRVDDIGIDQVVLLVTLTTSVATSLLFGLVPVLRCRALNTEVLKEAGRSTSEAPGRHRTRNTLVVAQIALALVLLIVSGLMARTFVAMRQVEPGVVRPAQVQTFGIALPGALIRDRQQVARTYEQIAERLKQVPGVAAVGLASAIPMDGTTSGTPVFVEDRPVSGTPAPRWTKAIGPGYFETLGTSLVAGRAITWTDIQQLTPVLWISENLAGELWKDPSLALGKRIGYLPGEWAEIVGVVGNVREEGLNQPAPTIVYSPMANQRFVSRALSYVVRSDRVGAPGFLRELQEAVWSVNKNVPLASMQTMDDIQADSMAQTSFAMVMLAIAAGGALLLALVGIYGVVSYIATARTHEIGIRIALGAQSGDVRDLFLRQGLALALTGIVLGLGAALLLTPIMSALLYGVRPMDPVTYAVVAIVLGAVTLLATYLPARRASRVPPIVALRSNL
jgi:putative ABC transport system permease protein